MKRSERRILTTHTGSLPRSPEMQELLWLWGSARFLLGQPWIAVVILPSILANGLDATYPWKNQPLANRILEQDCDLPAAGGGWGRAQRGEFDWSGFANADQNLKRSGSEFKSPHPTRLAWCQWDSETPNAVGKIL